MDGIKEIAKELVEVPGLLKEVYGDLAKPGVKQAGKALSAVIGLGNTLLWPVMLTNEKAKIALEYNLEKYRKRMEDVNDKDVSEVPPEIGVPITDKLAYITNEQLSDMYIELLANASSFNTSSLSHPSFVNAINNISPDEAIILKSLNYIDALPFIEVRLKDKTKNEWHTLNPMYTSLVKMQDITFPNNMIAYISNFEGLGIVDVRRDIYMIGDNLYEPLESDCTELYATADKGTDTHTLVFEKGRLEITPFGRLFLDACFSKNKA